MKFILLSMGLIAMALYLWALYEEMKEAQELKRKRRNYILNNHKQTKQ